MALKIKAVYDPDFSPIVKYIEAYERDVQSAPHKRVAISVERNKGYVRTLEMDVFADGVDDKFYSSVLTVGETYEVNDPTGLGAAGLALDEVTIDGDFDDLADDTAVYYFANGDAFYEIDSTTGKGDKTKPINAGTAVEGVIDYDLHWYWAYELTGPNAGDDVDTDLAFKAHTALHGEDGAEKTAAKQAAELKVSIAASATQVD